MIKVIDISCPVLWKIDIKGYQEYIRFLVTVIFQVFSHKDKKKSWKTLLKYLEYLEIFANLGTNEMVEEDTVKDIERFL